MHPFYGATTIGSEGDTPEIVRLEKDANVGDFENVWHSDVTWRVEPSLGSIPRAIEVPAVGGDMPPGGRERLRPAFPAATHPIVRTHPETGRKTPFVNRPFTQHILGMDADESAELLDFLYLQADFPEYQCRWQWKPGDVAFWDNRSTQHYAASDYYPNRRVMERITICGDKPR